MVVKVIIVDDEPYIVEALKSSIDWIGFQMEVALATTDPKEALAYVLDHPVQVVLTDISMPVLDGLTLIKRVKPPMTKVTGFQRRAYAHQLPLGQRSAFPRYTLNSANPRRCRENRIQTN